MEPGFYVNYGWEKFGIRVDSFKPGNGDRGYITGRLLRASPCGWRVVESMRGDEIFFVQDANNWKKIDITQ